MNHIRFISRLLNRPQLIAPAAGAAVLAALMPAARLDGWDGDADGAPRSLREYGVWQGVAIIPVIGKLVHRGGSMDAVSGLCSYLHLADIIADAQNDPQITALALDIDSPGGEADGCLDFAEQLAAKRGDKPMWAVVNQTACSAAYAIASACDRILIGESAHAGSIGVCSYHTDLSQMLSTEGVKITFLYAGARKIDGNPAQPLSDAAQAAWQSDIDQLYDRFCAVVAKNRGMTADAVRATEAAIFMGQDAVRVGLADSVSTFEDAVMALANRSAPEGARLTNPTTEPPAAPATTPQEPQPGSPEMKFSLSAEGGQRVVEQLQGAAATAREIPQTDPVAVAQACAAAGHPELIAGLLAGGASMDQVRDRLAAAASISEAAVQMGMQSLGTKLIAEGVSLEAARSILFDAKAAADAGRVTNTAHGTAPTPAAASKGLNPAAVYAAFNAAPRS